MNAMTYICPLIILSIMAAGAGAGAAEFVGGEAGAGIAAAAADEPTSRAAFLAHLTATLGRERPILDSRSAEASKAGASAEAAWTITTLQVKAAPADDKTLFAGVTMTLARRDVAAGDGGGQPLASLLRLYRRNGGGESGWALVAERLIAPSGFDPAALAIPDEEQGNSRETTLARVGGAGTSKAADIREMDFAAHAEPDGRVSLYIFWLENVAEGGGDAHYKMFGARVDNAGTRAEGGAGTGRGGTAPMAIEIGRDGHAVKLYSLGRGESRRVGLAADMIRRGEGARRAIPVVRFLDSTGRATMFMDITLSNTTGFEGEIRDIEHVTQTSRDVAPAENPRLIYSRENGWPISQNVLDLTGGLAGPPVYIGAINPNDSPSSNPPNSFFYMDLEGTITFGAQFTEGLSKFVSSPTGNFIVAWDDDYSTSQTIKWYQIIENGFVESQQQIPSYPTYPVIWTLTPYRAIIGSIPYQTWKFDPFSLKAEKISELIVPDIISLFGAAVPELNYLFLSGIEDNRLLVRMNYSNESGELSEPVILINTPEPGWRGLIHTKDGKTLIQLSGTEYCTIFKVLDDGSTTMTAHIDFDKEYDMRNDIDGKISSDDRYLFLTTVDDNNVGSFKLLPSGTIEPISILTGFPRAGKLALTHDDKFLVIAHSFRSSYPQAILSVFVIGEDGSLSYLEDKDSFLQNTITDLVFFPPRQPIPRPASWRME